MTNRQLEMIKELGFIHLVTELVIEDLLKKKTKGAKYTIDKIKDIKGLGKTYEIYLSKDKFTVISGFLVTKMEINQLTNILNLEYVRLGGALDNAGLWVEWTEEIHGGK